MKYLLLALLLLAPSAADAVWFDASWDYRVKVTIDADQVSGSSDHTSFPVYIDLSDLPADFHTNVKSDGCDIRVVESDEETETAFELVDYDDTGDTGELHAMVDTLSYNSDTDLYIYYGNSGASCYGATDTYGAEAVWGDYAAVYHFDTLTTDYSGNSNTLTNDNSVSTASGILGTAADFGSSNTNKRLKRLDNVLPYTQWSSEWTISAWVKLYNAANAGAMFWTRSTNGSQIRQVGAQKDPSSKLLSQPFPPATTVNTGYVGTTNWEMVALTWTPSTFRQVRNGTVIASPSHSWGSYSLNSKSFGIGAYPDSATAYLSALMDEVRVSNKYRDANWITTEHNNQSAPSTFYAATDPGGATGYANKVMGVAAANIGKVMGVATANISKVMGA